jgi:hypothetical protein
VLAVQGVLKGLLCNWTPSTQEDLLHGMRGSCHAQVMMTWLTDCNEMQRLR